MNRSGISINAVKIFRALVSAGDLGICGILVAVLWQIRLRIDNNVWTVLLASSVNQGPIRPMGTELLLDQR